MLRVNKVWQGELSYIYQLQLSPNLLSRWPDVKRFYLEVSADPKNYGITITKNKPKTSEPKGLSNIHRKHQKSGTIKAILKHPQHRDYILEFYGEEPTRISIQFTKPAEISFIKTTSLYRGSTKALSQRKRGS